MARMLTAREVAEELGYSTQTVTTRAKAGKIPGAVKIFGRWRFDADKLAAWRAAGESRDPWAAAPRGGIR